MTRERIEDIREIVLPFVRQRLIEINYENLGKADAKEFENDFNEILNLAIKALEQETVAENATSEKSEWIPVSERLPEINGNYLVQVSQGGLEYIAIDHRNSDNTWTDTDGTYRKIVAWQPLPQPYSEIEQ